MINFGVTLAMIGAALAALLAGCGSALGVGIAGEAGAGVIAEEPDRFGSILVLQALPGTQGIYGLLIAFIIILKIGVLGGSPVDLTWMQGMSFLAAGLPVGVVGLVSGVAQGKTAAAGIAMIAKRPEESGKAITFAVMVETYAVLSLLISFLMWNSIAV